MAWNMYRTIPILMVLSSYVQGAAQNQTVSICTSTFGADSGDHSALHLSCPRGGLIYIVQAFHGRSNSRLCAFTQGDTCLSNSLYWAPVVACLGKNQCAIPATPRELNTCGGSSDYLQVNYRCMADDSSSRFDICGGTAPGGRPSGVPLVAEGHIMTTNFPAPYPRQALCDCLITAAPVPRRTSIELELLDFHLEASPGCSHDFVELVRGDDPMADDYGTSSRDQQQQRHVAAPEVDRMCGGIGRWERRSVNSTWARLRLQTNDGREFRGFWIRVWAKSQDNSPVPVTVTCQNHLAPVHPVPPSIINGENNYPDMRPSAFTTNDPRIWVGTLPVGGSSEKRSGNPGAQAPISTNTGIIIGVCVAGVVTMVIINIVGIIICRRNVRANRSKQEQLEAAAHAAGNGQDSFSSMDTEYVSLNSNGAAYRHAHTHNLPTLYDTPMYSPLPNNSGSPGTGSPGNALPVADAGISDVQPVVERTPGVGQSSVSPSSYDYGMLPLTYTRKSHTIPGVHMADEDEDPYAVLKDFARLPTANDTESNSVSSRNDTKQTSFRTHAPRRQHSKCSTGQPSDPYRSSLNQQLPQNEWRPPKPSRRPPACRDYEEIDDYPMQQEPVNGHAPENEAQIFDHVLRSYRGYYGNGISQRAPERSVPPRFDQYEEPPARSQGSGSSGGRPSCSSIEDAEADREDLEHHKLGQYDLVMSACHSCQQEEADFPGVHRSMNKTGHKGIRTSDGTDYAASEASTTRSEYL